MKLLMAHRGLPGEQEAEPVLVEVTGSRAILRLDDGEKVDFDLADLRDVLDDGGTDYDGGTLPSVSRDRYRVLPASSTDLLAARRVEDATLLARRQVTRTAPVQIASGSGPERSSQPPSSVRSTAPRLSSRWIAVTTEGRWTEHDCASTSCESGKGISVPSGVG